METLSLENAPPAAILKVRCKFFTVKVQWLLIKKWKYIRTVSPYKFRFCIYFITVLDWHISAKAWMSSRQLYWSHKQSDRTALAWREKILLLWICKPENTCPEICTLFKHLSLCSCFPFHIHTDTYTICSFFAKYLFIYSTYNWDQNFCC